MPRLRLLFTVFLPPAAAIYGTHRYLTHLETLYPGLPAESTTSLALRTPQSPKSQLCRHVDVYSALVPLRALFPDAETRAGCEDRDQDKKPDRNLQEAWAKALINSPILRAEGRLIGLVTRSTYDPGDTESGNEFSPSSDGSPRKLLNGLFTITRRPPSSSQSPDGGLLVSWNMPSTPRELCETLARWGYPYRFMSGGRHEISAVEKPGGEVEVRFASAHDYEFVPEEGDEETQQKCLPAWTGRLHRGFARMVLHFAVKGLQP